MADDYWDWYNSAFGAPPVQGAAPGPPQMTPQQVADFYRSVGISAPAGQPPATRMVQSVPVNPMPRPVPERATTIARYATPTASDLVRGKSGISTIASYPTTPQVAQASIPGPNGYLNPNKGQERLVPGSAAAPGDALLASLGIVEPPRIAPIPFPRPDFPQVATALDVVPMPPLPIPRPKVAPIPFDRPNFGIGGPGFANLFGVKLPSIPRQMQTVAGRTAAMEPAMRQVMTGSPSRPTLTSAVAAQRSPGVSAQQAYDRANSAAVERAIANAKDPAAARRLNERLGNI